MTRDASHLVSGRERLKGRRAERDIRLVIEPAGGANRDRTGDLLVANQTLSQLSYGPSSGGSEDLGYWWVWEESNFRPHPYQGCALTN